MSKKDQLADIDEAIESPDELYESEDPWGRATTGCLLHDLQAGGGKGVLGYPYGWIINFVGGSSSGKTIQAHELIGNELNKNKDLVHKYIPTEYGDSFDTKGLYGYDASMDFDEIPKTIQEFDAYYSNFLDSVKSPKKGEDAPPSIAWMDSLDALRSNQTIEMAEERLKKFENGKEVEDKGSFQMEKAKFLSSHFFPGAACKIRHKKSILGIISQVRDNTSPMSFEKETRAGGRAMDFYCHSVQWLYPADKIFATDKDKKAGRSCGGIMRMKNKKSKTPRPGRIIHILFYFNFGVDDVGTSLLYLFDLLSDSGKMTVKNPVIEWDGNSTKFLKLRDEMYQDKTGAMRKKLDALVKEKWETAEEGAIKATPGSGGISKYGN